jgi:hypothetical protein
MPKLVSVVSALAVQLSGERGPDPSPLGAVPPAHTAAVALAGPQRAGNPAPPTTLQRIEKQTDFASPGHPFYSKSVVVSHS